MAISIALKRLYPDIEVNKRYYVGIRYKTNRAETTGGQEETLVKIEADSDT